MGVIEQAVLFSIKIANDPTQGYDQIKRWGPDWDCSSLEIASWDYAGLPVKAYGANTTHNMVLAFLKSGFIDVTSQINLYTGEGLIRGDVLVREKGHTAKYIGNGKIVNAQGNEKGGIIGGQTGDQTGLEITIRDYYNSPPHWDFVLRYVEKEDTMIDIMSKGPEVAAVQQFLINYGFGKNMNPALVGTGGPKTKEALLAFQAYANVAQSGVLDNATQAAMFRHAYGELSSIAARASEFAALSTKFNNIKRIVLEE